MSDNRFKYGMGVTFKSMDDLDTYRSMGSGGYSLGVMLTGTPIVSSPEPDTKLIDIVGRDAPLDYTEALDGLIHYKQRTVTMEFICLKDTDPQELISKLLNAIHGKRLKIYLDTDPYWYYCGRCVVGEPSYKKHAWYITVTATVDPFKYCKWSSLDYLGDEESLIDPAPDIIKDWYTSTESTDDYNYKDIEVDSDEVEVPIYTKRAVVPNLILAADEGTTFNVDYGDVTMVLQGGGGEETWGGHEPETFVADFKFDSGDSSMFVTGLYSSAGTISVEFRAVSL